MNEKEQEVFNNLYYSLNELIKEHYATRYGTLKKRQGDWSRAERAIAKANEIYVEAKQRT